MSQKTNIMKTNNGYRFDKNGWHYVSINGNASERGFAHGKLMANEIRELLRTTAYIMYEDNGRPYDFYLRVSNDFFKPIIKKNYPEIYEEMEAIAKGVNSVKNNYTPTPSNKTPSPSSQEAYSPSSLEAFTGDIDVDNIILINCMLSLDYLYGKLGALLEKRPELKPKYKDFYIEGSSSSGSIKTGEGGGYGRGGKDRCSSFIAVGSYTKDGKIVCAHNTFDNFISGQFENVILYIKPPTNKGFEILMQTFPGGIFSGTDFFVSSSGIFGSETTIGGFIEYENKDPICCRMRKAMQYGKTLSDYEKYLVENNSGDYACSWLFGDYKNNEIMRIELGLKFVNTERKKDGYFIGFNATYDPRIRHIECVNSGFDDIRRHQGSRRVRLADLMEENKGKIDINIAQAIISDHYDVYTKKEYPCSRTICSHYELDDRSSMSQADRPKPFQPRGALDGKVIDSTLAKEMSFVGRWGDSCGIPFDKDAFCNKQRQWKYLQNYLHNRPTQPWTKWSSNEDIEEAVTISMSDRYNESQTPFASTLQSQSQIMQKTPQPQPQPQPLKGGENKYESSNQIKDFIKLLTIDMTKSTKTRSRNNYHHKKTMKRH